VSRFLDGLDRVTVRLAETRDHFDDAITVRRAVYTQEKGWRSEDILIEEADSNETLFVGYMDGAPVASARLVSGSTVFEVEDHVDLSAYRALARCAEIERLALLPSRRHLLAAPAMFRAFYRYSLREGIRFIVASAPESTWKLYESIGFQCVAGPFWFEPRCWGRAYVLDFEEAAREWHENRPSLAECFERPVEGIG
jgi:GNAT superfamily N-acetyltransferase